MRLPKEMLVASPANDVIHDALTGAGWKMVGHALGWRKYWRYAVEGDLYIEVEGYRYIGLHREEG